MTSTADAVKAELARVTAALRETNERWYASNRKISKLEAKLERVELLIAKWKGFSRRWSGFPQAADQLEAALRGDQ